jgi:hypothetical protein
VLGLAGAARGDHRHVDCAADRGEQREVVAVLSTVAVHRGQQDLPRPALHALTRPLHGVAARRRAPAGHVDLPALAGPLGVDGKHDALVAEHARELVDQVRSRHGRRVDRHLVGPGVEHALRVCDLAHAAADRERHEHLVGRPAGQLDDRRALVGGRCDVEEHELVGAVAVVVGGELDRVPGVADVDEARPLDDAPRVDVHARDHTLVVDERASCASATVKRPS